MELQQMIERLLPEINKNQAKTDTKMDSPASRMDVNQASHEQMKIQIGSLASRTDINLKEMAAAIRAHSIRSELEETMRHRREDVLACVDQRTQGLRKEPNEKNKQTPWFQSAMRTIPTERPSLVGEVSAHFSG
jgi:flagellar hook-length control protein FliK